MIQIDICPHCKQPQMYDQKYDAYFCALCNIWLEHKCDDENCEYCSNRPEHPLE